MEFISDKINRLPKDLSDEFMQDALYYRLQVAIEAMTDINSMILKDLNLVVEDDYTNMEKLEKHGILPPKLVVDIKKLNGLRNVIVHQYNGVEEEIIMSNVNVILQALKEFMDHVRNNITDIIG